jgi:hypothetical protein
MVAGVLLVYLVLAIVATIGHLVVKDKEAR